MIALGWILFAFGLIRLIVSFANRIGKPYWPQSTSHDTSTSPEVSVLIPARNEEQRLGDLLADLSAADDAIREILVYDDRSDDATAEVVLRYAAENPRIKLLRGGELPRGWLGKNHACYRLALHAEGRYLLFLDADVRIRRQAVVRALAYAQRSGVALLSVFPRQRMPDPGTRLAVPLMNWILLSLLPLSAVRRSKQTALSAANGQFMLFDSAVYRALQPHLQCRMSPVEDVAIARTYKRSGRPIAVLLGRNDVECTMYSDLREAVAGFSRNFFAFFGGNEGLCYLFAISTTAAPVVIFGYIGTLAGAVYLIVVILIRVLVSTASCQSAVANVLLTVPQLLVMWRIILTASVRKRKKSLLWKGRNIYQ